MFDFIKTSPYLVWLKFALFLAIISAAAFSGYHLRDLRADRDMAEFKQAQAEKESKEARQGIADIKQQAKEMNQAARDTQAVTELLHSQIQKLISARNGYVKKNPLPSNCKPDGERVRQLNEAIDAANSSLSSVR